MEIIKFIQSFSNSFLDSFFTGVTMLGEQYFTILFVLVVFWCVNKKFGYKLGFALGLGVVFNGMLKDIFKAPRPIGKEGIRSLRTNTATGYSFPSGHTQNTTTFWTSLMINIKRSWLYIVGTIMIVLTAISRLYLGVHWPKDVIGGIIFGIISALAANYLFDYMDKNNDKRVFLILVIIALIGLIFFKSRDYAKAVGVFLGFFIGYVIEDKYVKFEVKTKLLKQVIKVLLGAVVVAVVMVLFKKVLPVSRFSDLIRYFMVGLWCTAGATYMFKKLRLYN
ncbi:phosphatase PAP2 family protein [Haloimpatiens sp. FM7330]|uniref:phosphatase PAP2 family protein n=1 Tax=Haloimpatiens sp. FM7330 TaxID=3298610 RepID=UPI0036335A0F